MTRLRIGFIGTGRPWRTAGATGFGMAYEHASGYKALPEACELVACCDLVEENARAFAEEMGIDESGIFTDYHKMLSEARLDMVSICTWPALHASMVIDSAVAGVRAIHCEKPMADTWGAARLMAQECERRGVQLTFNHQRRFGAPFRKAAELLHSGAIGTLSRIELACDNIYDWGTHYIDLCGLYVGEQPAEWVIGQIDYRRERKAFGMHVENQALGSWKYRNGVFALISTGPGEALIGANNRLLGTDGCIEVGVHQGPLLRIQRATSREWETIDTGEDNLHGPNYVKRAVVDTVQALLQGREPELSARHALNATEIIFALYESSRRRARIDLPLTISDHPLVSLVESGEIHPEPCKQ